jgi:hypothetical protein
VLKCVEDEEEHWLVGGGGGAHLELLYKYKYIYLITTL